MNNHGAQTTLAAVSELTQAMLSAAEREDWEEVAHIETVRGDAIVACCAGLGAHGDVAAVVDGIRAVLAMDQRIMRLATATMTDLQDELGMLRSGRVALQAYEAARAG